MSSLGRGDGGVLAVGKKAKKRQGGAWATAHGVLRVTEGNGKQQGFSVVVDVGQHSTRCRKFSSNREGEDAAWFATSTEAVRAFREFLFGEDTVGSGGDKSKLSHGRVSDSGDVVEASQSPRGRLRSYVCLRQNRWTGLRYAVVMARLANGQLRAISFHDKRISKLRRDGSRSSCEDELLRKAINFLRSISFKHWREQVPIEAPSQHDHGGPERSLKHAGAFVGYEKGEKVDCSCGKNRSRGQMVLCESCGTREHLECSGYRSDTQMPADHICSACLRAQKEEVIVINLDEQEECRLLSSGDSWTHSKARGRGDESICCLCGCEDNEEFETMIQPCTCDGGAVFAHPSCVSSAMECLTPKDRNKQSSTCQACGRQGTEREAKPVTLKRTSRRPSNSDNPTKSVKRLRSTSQHPGKVEVDENLTGKHENEGKSLHERTDPEPRKLEGSLLGRRFSDVASTVPIKKRRIQIMDAIRSPSPPSRSPSPNIIKPDIRGTTSRMDVDDAPDGKEGACTYGQRNGVESGHWGKRVDKGAVKFGHRVEGGTEVYDERLPRCTENKVEEEETEVHDYEIPTMTSTIESFETISNCGESERPKIRMEGSYLTAEQVDSGCSEAEPKIDSKQMGGENAHGDRSHWDLNMYMDAWERPCEDFSRAVDPNQLAQKSGSEMSGETEEHDGQSIGKAEDQGERLEVEFEKDKSIEIKEECHEQINEMASDVLDKSGTSHDTLLADANLGKEADAEAEKLVENNLSPRSHVPLQTVVGIEDRKDNNEEVDLPSHGDADAPLDVDANCVSAETDSHDMKIEQNEEVTAVSKGVKNAEDLAMKADPEYKEEFAEYDTFEEEDEPDPDPVDKTKSEEAHKAEEGQISTDDWVEDAGEELEAEDVDYGDSEEGEDAVDEKASPSGHAEVDYEGAEQGEIHESGVKQENGAENRESPGKEPGSDQNSEGKDGQLNLIGSNEGSKEGEGTPQKKSSITGRIKSSGWDQLPEGFETAEDALRASKDLLRRGGRPISWSGSRGAPGARPLSGSSRASQFESSYERFRNEDPSWSRHDHHDHRGNEMYEADTRFYSREFGRGRSRGGASSPLVPRRGDLWMNGSTRPQGQWAGPKHHLSPPGRFTDGVGFGPHGQANAAAVAAAKVESSGFVVAPDGTITKAGSPGAAGRSAGRPFPGGGRNPAPLMLNPNRGTDPGLSDAMAPRGGMGPGRGLGLSPGLRVNVGMGMGAGMGVSPGLRGGLPVSRGVMDRHPYGPGIDSQASRTPSSRSGYPGDHPDKWDRREHDLSPSGFKGRRSPVVRDHRRSRSRSRSISPRKSGNPALRASRSPGHVKAKEVRESSPAGRSSLPSPPKLPLPPPPPRGQRSPPAGLKRLSDKRDGDRRFFEHEYHQPAGREHRTSGWDLGPADVGEPRRALGHEAARERVSKFDDMDRSHDRRIGGREESRRDPSKPMRRDKPSNSSRHIGSRDGEDDVAPRRRRPPS